MPAGKIIHPDFTDEFLEEHGAAKYSAVVMTPTGYMTNDAWEIITPKLCDGLRYQVEQAASDFGIDTETAAKLKILLGFDGFGAHWKTLAQLVHFATHNVLCLLEDRDSSEINQVIM